MIFVVATIFAIAICFSDIPSALSRANKEHVQNGHKPNAGVAFVPDLIVIILIWSLGTFIIDRFLGRTWAWGLLLSVSVVLILLNLWQAKRSTREYLSFIRSRSSDIWPSYVNGKIATQCWIHPNGEERVFLVSRSEGTFTTDYERYSSDSYENCWIPYGSSSIYDSEATAIKEAQSEYPWIADIKPRIRQAEQDGGVNS